MPGFLLDNDLNLAFGRRLRDRQYEVTPARDAGIERLSEDAVLAFAFERGLIVLTHNERRFASPSAPAQAEHAGILYVPQAAQEDVPRVAEAIHRFLASAPSLANRRYRFGLRSGWSALEPEGMHGDA